MAMNPMQRKSRNSFLVGMILAFVIAAAPVAFLYMNTNNLKQEIDAAKKKLTSVYVLNTEVKSGQVITSDMFSIKQVDKDTVPSNALGSYGAIDNVLATYSLTDKEGNEVKTNDSKLYIFDVTTNRDVELKKEENTDNYYKEINGQKVYVELTQKPVISKIDLKANTVITTKYLAKSDEMVTDDTRIESYNVIVLPAELQTGDFVDIRLMLPNGQDYIVLSKKEVNVPNYNGTPSTDTINLTVREDELLVLSSAIVDSAKAEGSKLYAIKYVEPGNQATAVPTYVASADVLRLLSKDANALTDAKNQLVARYNENRETIRADIQSRTTGEDSTVVTKVQESITKTQESRQQYLQTLTGGTN